MKSAYSMRNPHRDINLKHSVIRAAPHAVDSILAQPVRDSDKVRGQLKPFVPKMDKRLRNINLILVSKQL